MVDIGQDSPVLCLQVVCVSLGALTLSNPSHASHALPGGAEYRSCLLPPSPLGQCPSVSPDVLHTILGFVGWRSTKSDPSFGFCNVNQACLFNLSTCDSLTFSTSLQCHFLALTDHAFAIHVIPIVPINACPPNPPFFFPTMEPCRLASLFRLVVRI